LFSRENHGTQEIVHSRFALSASPASFTASTSRRRIRTVLRDAQPWHRVHSRRTARDRLAL
jgi:hypothetical protein